MNSKPPGKPRFPVIPPPPPKIPKPQPPSASGARAKFQETETPTGRRHQKVSDFYQLGQLYDELRPEFQRTLMGIAHSLIRLQNEITNLTDSVEIEVDD